jgi:hypothetical protein
LHAAIHTLYECECCTPAVGSPHHGAEGSTPTTHTHTHTHSHTANLSVIDDIKAAFTAAAKHLFRLKGFTAANMQDAPVKALLNATYTHLKQAINSGINYRISDGFLKKLQTDVYVFSGMKTYVQLKETANALVAEDGKGIRSFGSFTDEVRKINATYNERYLRTEYHYAATTAQSTKPKKTATT